MPSRRPEVLRGVCQNQVIPGWGHHKFSVAVSDPAQPGSSQKQAEHLKKEVILLQPVPQIS